jgi:23S rRNA (guanosine2251-2'-O)-methyltransferase
MKLVIANNVRPPFLDELVDAARAGKVVYQMAAPEAVDALCPGVRHQGVACRVTEAKLVELESFLKNLPKDNPALIVVLDHIEDPHNLGAVVRSAEAAGAAAVVFPKRRSALPGGTVVKVSAGAALRVPMISVVNIARSVEQLKEAGFWAAGLENGAEASLWRKSEDLQSRTALVVGSEDEGISRLVGESCDQLFRIPIQGGVGSLNASVAAALGMFEWSRRHNTRLTETQ